MSSLENFKDKIYLKEDDIKVINKDRSTLQKLKYN